jgi:hypothetical protein
MRDNRQLLSVLRAELEFLEEGGYRQSPRQAWRAPLVFADFPDLHELHGYAGKTAPLQ